MVLGKLPVPGRPTNLDYSRARTYCAYSRCGWGWFGPFFSFPSSFSLSLLYAVSMPKIANIQVLCAFLFRYDQA